MGFALCDRGQAFLLPPDMRDWLPANHIVHFIVEAVERVPLSAFHYNKRGTGSEQYHPRAMLCLMLYGYSKGVFSSRRLELEAKTDLAARYATANQQPDHSTIAKFRRENHAAIAAAFVDILQLAREMQILRLNTISVDGTKIAANASRSRSVTYERAEELGEQLRLEVEGLLVQAERADAAEEERGDSLRSELADRQALVRQMDRAQRELEQRHRRRRQAERARISAATDRPAPPSGRRSGAPPADDRPAPHEQHNLTDPDSRLMRQSRGHHFCQGYNAQAVVDAETHLIVGARVTQNANDRQELVPSVAAVPAVAGTPQTVLADNGYATEAQVTRLEARGLQVLVAPGAAGRRRHDFRPTPKAGKPARQIRSAFRQRMANALRSETGRALYALRKQTVEPVFGVIKSAMGFRQFHVRGLEGVAAEWLLVALAYNMKRLHNLSMQPATA